MRAWTAAAAASPAVALVDNAWGWLVFGGAALVRAGLSFRDVRSLEADDRSLPMPVVAAPAALALRRSAAAEPLRRGETGLAALAALARSVEGGPSAGPVRSAMAGAVELVDGLRVNAGRVVACESAARAVGDPARRNEILGTAGGLLAAMREATDALDALLTAATEVVGVASASSPELIRLTEEIERLRAYADGLLELTRISGLRNTV